MRPPKYDFSSNAFKNDPMSHFDRVRAIGPVVQTRMAFLGRPYMITTHAAVSEMLKDSTRFVMQPENAGMKKAPYMRWWMPRSIKILIDNMLQKDNPDHKRLRGRVDKVFSRRRLDGLEDKIRATAHALLDQTADQPQFDLVSSYARELPLAVICDLIGLPVQDQANIRADFLKIGNVSSPAAMIGAMRAINRVISYLETYVANLRKNPDGTLISDLAQPQEDGQDLSNSEMVAMVFLLFAAGHETTTHLISGGTLALLQHPDQLAALRADPALIPSAIEEMLRFVSPVQMTNPRFVAQDTLLAGVALEQGATVMALLASANCDPDVINSPHEFDIKRPAGGNLEFGGGMHFCLGHHLARLESRIAFEVLLERCPTLARADSSPIKYTRRIGIRQLRRLNVTR